MSVPEPRETGMALIDRRRPQLQATSPSRPRRSLRPIARCCLSAASRRRPASSTRWARSMAFARCRSARKPRSSAPLMAAATADRVITGSRSHGHMLALGIAPERIMAELMGRTTGISGGKGGTLPHVRPRAALLRRPRNAGPVRAAGRGPRFRQPIPRRRRGLPLLLRR